MIELKRYGGVILFTGAKDCERKMINMKQEFKEPFYITEDMTFESLEKLSPIAEAGPYLIGGNGQYHDMVRSLPLSQGTVLGWNAETMIEGIEYLMDRIERAAAFAEKYRN